MNRSLLFFLGLMLTGVLVQSWFPWWSWALWVFLLVLLFRVKTAAGLWLSFLAGFLLWGGYAGWLDGRNAGLLSDRMGVLFNGIGRWGILGVTSLLGGLIALLAGWTALWTRRVFTSP